jgi:hypothetical protein
LRSATGSTSTAGSLNSPRGRFGDIHAARRNDASRIAIRGEALLAFWRSGKCATTDNLAEFGLNVRMLPWLFVRGSPGTLPWAAMEFDRDRLARPPRRARAATGG